MRVCAMRRERICHWSSVRSPGYLQPMAKRPSRIELPELDIDLRLADLWGEACGISEWN